MSILPQSIFAQFIFLTLSGCVLGYITEPDAKAIKEQKKYDQLPCSKITGSSCQAKSSQQKRRYKLSDSRYLTQLKDPNAAIRTQTATEVAELGLASEQIILTLENLVKTDPSKWVRRASVKSLAKISGDRSREVIKLACKDKDEWVRQSANNALSKLHKGK